MDLDRDCSPPGTPGPSPHTAAATTRVLLLRHAETAAPDRYHGAESDVPLGERGQAQALAAARALAGLGLEPVAVYVSTMQRARETARPIAEALGRDLAEVANLHERRMGSLSGRLQAEGRPIYEATRDRWQAGDLDASHEGGESYRELHARVVPAFRALIAAHPGQTLIVVAHGVVIRVLLTALLPGSGPHDFERFGIDFVAVNDLRFDGQHWSAAALNTPAVAICANPHPHPPEPSGAVRHGR